MPALVTYFAGHATVLPCPFCGGDAYSVAQDRHGDAQYCLACRVCAAEGPWAMTHEGAIRIWNMRTIQSGVSLPVSLISDVLVFMEDYCRNNLNDRADTLLNELALYAPDLTHTASSRILRIPAR